MRYDVELQIEDHWYPISAPPASESAAQAVAQSALTEGLYRVRPADGRGTAYELFRVPAWGRPIALGRAIG